MAIQVTGKKRLSLFLFVTVLGASCVLLDRMRPKVTAIPISKSPIIKIEFVEKQLACADSSGAIYSVTPESTNKEIFKAKPTLYIDQVAFDTRKDRVYYSGVGTIYCYQISQQKLLFQKRLWGRAYIGPLQILHSGELLLALGETELPRRLIDEAGNFKDASTLNPPEFGSWTSAISYSNAMPKDLVAISDESNGLCLYDVPHHRYLWKNSAASMRKIFGKRIPSGATWQIALGPDLVVVNEWNTGDISILSAKDGKLQKILQADEPSVVALSLSPNQKYLALLNDKGQVFLWDITTGELVTTLENAVPAKSLTFSTSEPELAVGYGNGYVIVYEVKNSA